jgi:replicative DNA helicase
LRDCYCARALSTLGARLNQDAQASGKTAEELLDWAGAEILHLSTASQNHEAIPLDKSLRAVALELLSDGPGTWGLKTGFREYDRYTFGLQKQTLNILAGRPSQGKTTLALNIARKLAQDEPPHPVGIITLEAAHTGVALSFLCAACCLDGNRARGKFLSQEDIFRLKEFVNSAENIPVYVDDSPALTLHRLRARARRLQATYKIELLIVDYLQLIVGPKSENRQQEVAAVSKGLKALAGEMDIPILALCQLNRASETRADRRPRLSDLRESGEIEADADTVLLIHRPEFYNAQDEPGVARLELAKQRMGPTGTFRLTFRSEMFRFEDYAPESGGE